MSINKGKDFEERFKKDWKTTFGENCDIYRIPDQMSKRKLSSGNPCDFICYLSYDKLFYIECKSHKGNTFPWTSFPQYKRLKELPDAKGKYKGVILWMIEHDIVVWLPISLVTKMINDGKKSFNVKMLETNEYKILQIPSVKLRTFMKSDYTVLKEGVEKYEYE